MEGRIVYGFEPQPIANEPSQKFSQYGNRSADFANQRDRRKRLLYELGPSAQRLVLEDGYVERRALVVGRTHGEVAQGVGRSSSHGKLCGCELRPASA